MLKFNISVVCRNVQFRGWSRNNDKRSLIVKTLRVRGEKNHNMENIKGTEYQSAGLFYVKKKKEPKH